MQYLQHLLPVTTLAVAVVATVLPGAPPSASATPASSVDGTSIVRSEDGTSTTVLVHGQGAASTETGRENRSMHHSDLQPTGRFARKGDVLRVTVPTGAPTAQLDIGLDGPHSGLDTGSHRRWDLAAGTTSVTADRDGAVHLVSTAPSGSAQVVVTGGDPTPTFVRGSTSDATWAEEIREYRSSPIFTIVGERILGVFQSRTLGAVPTAINERVAELDRVIDETDSVYGLSRDATGYASHKSPHRISITSPDSGAGYASATNGRITFQVDTGAAADLFRLARYDLWGYWHEVGHTYQTPSYNWSGLGEVLVNVSPLAIQGRTWGANRLDSQAVHYDNFFKIPVAERNHHGAGTWGKLFMFDQLRRAFGEGFYPRLNQELRVDRHLGLLSTSDDASKKEAFARAAAKVSDRDLRPFFEQWGIPLTEGTQAELAKRPALTANIWESRNYAGTGTEHAVTPLVLPTGRLDTVAERVFVGQRTLRDVPAVTGLASIDGVLDAHVGHTSLTARYPGQAAGSLSVELHNDRGSRDVLRTTVAVDAGQSFAFRGLSDREIGRLALNPDEKSLRFLAGTTYNAHDNFGDNEYIGFELRSADDLASLGNWSVNGNQTGHPLEARFEPNYEDQQIMVVRHKEARTRLTWFHDGETVTGRADVIQKYRIVDDRLIRAEDPVMAVPGDPAQLVRDASVEVGARFRMLLDSQRITATLELTAPAGTSFDGDADLVGWTRVPGGAWVREPSLAMTDGKRAHDGRSVEYSTNASVRLTAGTEVEWRPKVSTPKDAAAGAGALGYTLTGTSTMGTFTTNR